MIGPISTLIRKAADLTGIPEADIIGTNRAAHLVRVRSAIVYAARTSANHGYSEIARVMRRDHSSIIVAEERAHRLIDIDPEFARLCGRLLPRHPAGEAIDMDTRSLDVPIVVQEQQPANVPPGLYWSVEDQTIILGMIAPDGFMMTAQMNEHQLHAMATDLAGLIRAMPPRPESERTLQ